MKILLITDRLDAGGAETHVLSLARGLMRLGARVTIASGGGALASACDPMGIRHIPLPLPSHNPIALFFLHRRIRRLVQNERFDIVHAHARIPALLIQGCRKYGAAEIVTVHARFYVNCLLSRICYWGMHTISVSEDLLAYVCGSYGVAPERVTVIPNGIDCSLFSPASHMRDPLHLGILFASRLDADCSLGAELLCTLAPRLYEKNPNLRISIAGGGSETSRILTLAKKANQSIGKNIVTVLGAVKDMPSLMQAHTIFVGVSRAAIEAAACGCAVVLCGNEGYLGILDDSRIEMASKSNFCARGCSLPSANLLNADLLSLMDDPLRCEQIATACRAWIVSHCNIEAVCQKTASVYQKCMLLPVQKKALIGGYFGCDNLGDDAILSGLLHELANAHRGICPCVLTGSPRRDKRRYGVPCINRKSPVPILLALIKADVFLLGGGSLLQNVTSNRSLYYYLALLRLARLLGKPTVLYAAGIGPLLGKEATRLTARVLSECRYISLRDDGSKQFLASIGVDASKLHEGADAALLMPSFSPAHLSLARSRMHLEKTQDGFLCIVLKGGIKAKPLRAILLAAVRTVCQKRGIVPLFAVFDRRHDEADTRIAAAESNGHTIICQTPLDAKAVLSKAQAVLTMRLHAMILATSTSTPALGVISDVRDKKLTTFARISGQDVLAESEYNAPAIAEKLEKLLKKAPRDPLLARASDELRKKAQKDLANIVEMIYNIDSKS